jgi:hypothetical protein
MTANPQPFTPEQRAVIVAEFRRIMAEPPPFNPRPYGCLTMVAGIVLFLLVPQLGIRLPPPWGTVLAALFGLMIVGGAVAGVLLGSGVYGRAASRARQALDALAAEPPPDDTERLRQAVALIAHAVVSEGPTTSNAMDRDAARARLGERFGYVLAVEQVLNEEIGPQQVFTGQ